MVVWPGNRSSRADRTFFLVSGRAVAQAPAANEQQLSTSLIKVAPGLTTHSVRPRGRVS